MNLEYNVPWWYKSQMLIDDHAGIIATQDS